jgi:hypothetical protein
MTILLCSLRCDRRRLLPYEARGDIALVIELRFSLSALQHVLRELRSDGPEVARPGEPFSRVCGLNARRCAQD